MLLFWKLLEFFNYESPVSDNMSLFWRAKIALVNPICVSVSIPFHFLWKGYKRNFEFGASNEKSWLWWLENVASADCSQSYPRAWGDYLSSKLSWVTAWRFDSLTCLPCPSSRWVSPCVLYTLMIGLMVVLLTFFRGWWTGEYGFSNLGVDAILGNGCGIQGQNYAELLQGCEMTAEFTAQIGFFVYNILPHSKMRVGINTQVFYCSCPWLFLRRGDYEMLFNVDVVNLLLKNNGKSVVWSALVVSEWVVVSWSRKRLI